MGLPNRERIRVRFDSEFFGSARPWQMFCPCCHLSYTFANWSEAAAYALVHIEIWHCLFCIERQMPAGHDDVLGDVFERCPICTAPCEECDGIAVYPAKYNTPTELVDDLRIVRMAPIFCDGCTGVVAVIPLDPEVPA
jgi:hypothetical protein